jgi:hypothetical protein
MSNFSLLCEVKDDNKDVNDQKRMMRQTTRASLPADTNITTGVSLFLLPLHFLETDDDIP